MIRGVMSLVPLLGAACLLLVTRADADDACASPSAVAALADASRVAIRTATTTVKCTSVWVIDASGTRREPDRCTIEVAPSAGVAAGTAVPPVAADCEPPWFIDSNSIQRLRPECLAAVQVFPPTLPPPAAVSVAVQPQAPPMSSASSAPHGCDPMYYVDARGIRRLKLHCL
jgi:hypothetical protein